MIVRSGLSITVPVLFSSGHPDAGIAWTLYGTTGSVISTGTAAVASDAVSINLLIDGTLNTLPVDVLYGSRDFAWSYTVGGAIVNGEQRYSIEARAPFGASNDGVRAKLGVEAKDLPDGDISLIRAYISFRDVVSADALDLITDDGITLAVRDAIEASAALALIPTMAVRVASLEDSGTNSFKRQAIDWEAVALYLAGLVDAGIIAVLPDYDPSPTGALFILAVPASDPVTGGTYT